MARIAGVNLPSNKRLVIALTYIYGIGAASSMNICKKLKIDVSTRVNKLTDSDIIKIRELIDKKYTVEGLLRSFVATRIKLLKDLKTYRGSRHIAKLPSRGQNTHNNASTRRGKKTLPVSNKKKI